MGSEQIKLWDDDMIGRNAQVIRPIEEITAYEALWPHYNSVPKLTHLFNEHNHDLPSVVALKVGLTRDVLNRLRDTLESILPFTSYSALFYGDFEYPSRLGEAKNPIEVMYYQGSLDLLSSKKIVSVVGTRQPTKDGIKRTQRLTKLLVEKGYTIMSGLAEGIDSVAHRTAIDSGGKTIGVIGTPLCEVYPKSNRHLQETISTEHLLVSQVPFYYYSLNNWKVNRAFFPERNRTMSALSQATIIIEASDTSGTLYQARAAISQKRKLLILNSCFESGLSWPERFLKQGAKRIAEVTDVFSVLEQAE